MSLLKFNPLWRLLGQTCLMGVNDAVSNTTFNINLGVRVLGNDFETDLFNVAQPTNHLSVEQVMLAEVVGWDCCG
ncbi:hypothetical protein [Algibacillus agarilyticus]|uniref:hypothetical protein n=1 Tax=Algibacillus agarilyticus TaxID=2234133 RepID=UPI0018E56C45|nr:hypothetical protein [Algibacillus agarilyticus]